MKLGIIGVGQAGGKILDKFLWYDQQTGTNIVQTPLAVNTARADLHGLENIPKDNRILIGQAKVKGNGVGADNELGAEIARQNITEIGRELDQITSQVDALLIIAALGGGTGSGAGPVIANHLKQIYTQPVYALGILPTRNEGNIYTLNAARSLQTFLQETDNLLLFDNDAWRKTGESLQEAYDQINEEITRRFGTLFTAGKPTTPDNVAESVVDSSEIINTLSETGISTIGYATAEIESTQPTQGLLSRLLGKNQPTTNDVQNTNRITSLVRKATLGRLTLPCETNDIERALLLLAGPPDYLNRKGIERGRKWIEEETGTMEIRGGDYPLPNENKIAAAVLLSGVTNSSRIKELQQVAVEAQHNIEETIETSHETLQQLITDDDEELDPLF